MFGMSDASWFGTSAADGERAGLRYGAQQLSALEQYRGASGVYKSFELRLRIDVRSVECRVFSKSGLFDSLRERIPQGRPS
jgi:hypothetical protein